MKKNEVNVNANANANNEKAFSLLDRLTNIDKERFEVAIEGKTFDLLSKVDYSAGTFDIKFVPLYKLDIYTGKVNVMTFNFNMKNVDALPFALEVVRYFYFVQNAQVVNDFETIKDLNPDEMTDDHKIRFEVMKRRINNAKEVFTKCNANCDVCVTSKNVVRALNRAKLAMYDDAVQVACKSVMEELKNLYNVEMQDSNLPNVKTLRGLIAKLMLALWVTDDKVILKHGMKCNDALARDVYALYNNGRKIDKMGNVEKTFAKDSKIALEIVLACIEALQIKNVKETESK